MYKPYRRVDVCESYTMVHGWIVGDERVRGDLLNERIEFAESLEVRSILR
jgi:hypothetical protein